MNTNEHRLALPAGCQLNDLEIKNVLGHGGFGITYRAWDRYLKKYVALKEYLPNDIAVRIKGYSVVPKSVSDREDFEYGLEQFIEEACVLERFNHPNILRVIRVFEAYQTAYMVTQYEKGRTLTAYLDKLGKPPTQAQLRKILMPLLDGLETVHQANYLHRDIKPDNIYICGSDNRPVLIDFGSARQSLGSRTKNMTIIVTGGYAPFEQYTTSAKRQGNWSDIYSMAAVLYRAITGMIPPDASDRQDDVSNGEPDPLLPLSQAAKRRYTSQFVDAIEQGLALLVTERPQSVAEWREMFGPPKKFTLSRKNRVKSRSTDTGQKQPLLDKIGKNQLAIIAASVVLILSAVGIWSYAVRESSQRSETPDRTVIRKIIKPAPEPAAITSGLIYVQTKPQGAAIFIAGKKMGLAPITLTDLTPGNVTVEADGLPGYNMARKTVKITAGQKTPVTLELPIATGLIDIKSVPENAKWHLDGKHIGATPYKNAKVKPGRHLVTIKHKGYEDQSSEITVTAGKTTAVVIVLKKITQPKGKTWTESEFTNMEFIWVEGGSFRMGDQFGDGDSDEKPVHEVRVDGFYMGKFEITQAQWHTIMGDNPSKFKKGDNYPVEKVSWVDTQEFIRKLSQKSGKTFRLPTEAEWEYAARSGGKKEKYSGGDSLDKVAWYNGNSKRTTHPVGGKAANGLGLHDMSGNVWEWCADWYDENYYNDSPRDNPKGPSLGLDRVFRGGGLLDSPWFVRVADRLRVEPGDRGCYLGFRLVLPVRDTRDVH